MPTNQRTLVHALVCCLSLLVSACGLAQQNAFLEVPLPEITGPLPVSEQSWPQLAVQRTQAPVDLAAVDYVEEEFLVQGQANVYDWNADGGISVITADAPYTTRILVRRPRDSDQFSGNVIVETLNNARQYDWAFIWALSYEHFINRGDVYVAVTHNPQAIDALKKFDPVRYASLSFNNPAPAQQCGPDNAVDASEEGLKWDMISQVGALLRSPSGPLAGFGVEKIYASTHTRELTTYANAVHRYSRLATGMPVYDGFVIKDEYAPVDRIRRCAAEPAAGDVRRIIRNAGVPVIRVIAQGDVLATWDIRREDSDDPADAFRLWEVAGAPHMDKIYYQHMPVPEDQEKAGQAAFLANWPMAYACTPDIDLLDFPVMRHAMNAAFAALDNWVRSDNPPGRAERIAVANGGTAAAAFITDEFGNARGGVRNVYLDVPVATYYPGSPGPAVCNNLGRRMEFSWQRLQALYGSPQGYIEQVRQSLDALAGKGWLTPSDSETIDDELTKAVMSPD